MTDDEIDRLMKRCQRGFGGFRAIDQAHDCAHECYGALGRLQIERQHLALAVQLLAEIYWSRHPGGADRPEWLREALAIARTIKWPPSTTQED